LDGRRRRTRRRLLTYALVLSRLTQVSLARAAVVVTVRPVWADGVGPNHILDMSPFEVGPDEVGIGEVGAVQVGARQIRVGQVGSGEIRVIQIGVTQVAVFQIGASE